jgi:hypothetical protein
MRAPVGASAFKTLSKIERDKGFVLDNKERSPRQWKNLHLIPRTSGDPHVAEPHDKTRCFLSVNPTIMQRKKSRPWTELCPSKVVRARISDVVRLTDFG